MAHRHQWWRAVQLSPVHCQCPNCPFHHTLLFPLVGNVDRKERQILCSMHTVTGALACPSPYLACRSLLGWQKHHSCTLSTRCRQSWHCKRRCKKSWRLLYSRETVSWPGLERAFLDSLQASRTSKATETVWPGWDTSLLFAIFLPAVTVSVQHAYLHTCNPAIRFDAKTSAGSVEHSSLQSTDTIVLVANVVPGRQSHFQTLPHHILSYHSFFSLQYG